MKYKKGQLVRTTHGNSGIIVRENKSDWTGKEMYEIYLFYSKRKAVYWEHSLVAITKDNAK